MRKAPNKNPRLRYITRFNFTRVRNGKRSTARGWWVRYRTKNPTPFSASKFFSDKGYGSKALALNAALVYRNRLLTTHGKPYGGTVAKGQLVLREFRYSSTRLPSKKSIRVRRAWCAIIQVAPNVTLRKQFAVALYGPRKSKKLGQLWLTEQEQVQKKNYAHLQPVHTRKLSWAPKEAS